MGNVIFNKGSSSSTPRSHLSSLQLSHPVDCSPFLNWTEEAFESENEMAVVFRSLVATLRLQPVLDASLEAKAKTLLESVENGLEDSADDFLKRFASSSDDSSTDFIQSIVVLISSPNRAITTSAMELMESLTLWCSADILLLLVKADLIPQIVKTLNPLSLSFSEALDIHMCLMKVIQYSFWLATPDGLEQLGIEDDDRQQAGHEMVFQQVLVPSEKYISHLCVKCSSLVDGDQSRRFLALLAQLLWICPYYQPAMEFVLHMPVFITIPSCLTFFENDHAIWYFLYYMVDAQRRWNKQGGAVRQMGTTVLRKLRMEGIEGVVERKLQNDQNEYDGSLTVDNSIILSNLLGMNLPEQE
ncbi:hypothetical protein BLNAU_18567 [Blattamonas nauphoetae]|uniref:Uncharacterized protein n=1 Tax=Blattamonas nauphoetae TaxID=2049346 RepID=A0ABQ9X8L7_9EUKA|nr:hypothetical protein BLNAU_18567 [Blattamonas nauphoetae]